MDIFEKAIEADEKLAAYGILEAVERAGRTQIMREVAIQEGWL